MTHPVRNKGLFEDHICIMLAGKEEHFTGTSDG